MGVIMQVNSNPESFQAQYERLVENWLTKFAQINQELLKNLELSVVDEKGEKQTLYGINEAGEKVCDISPEQIEQIESGELKPDIQLSQLRDETIVSPSIRPDQVKVFVQDEMGDSELVYGKTGSRMINRLSQERIEQLQTASTAEIGNKVESEPLKVKVGDEVIFEVDESGQVLVNDSTKLQQVLDVLDEPIQEQQQQLPTLDDYYDDYDSFDFEVAQEEVLVELVSDLVEGLPDEKVQTEPESEPELQDELDEFFSIDLDAFTPIPEETIEVPLVQNQEEVSEKTGLDCVEDAIEQLKDGSLKTVLTLATQELRMEVAEQQLNPELDQLMKVRTQASQDPSWWNRLSSEVEEMLVVVRDTFVGNRAASTLKQFADKLDLQSGQTFEGAEYNLSRKGNNYTLTDKQGNELLKFKSSILGVKVDKSLPGLDDTHFRKIEVLRKDLTRGNQPQGAFVSQAKAEAQYLKRVGAITSALSHYAAQRGGTAKVEGRFSYDWEATSTGKVMIKNKQGDVLLACGQGHMKSRMSEKDLQHFEEMLPNLGMQKQTSVGAKKQMEVG